MANKYLRNLIRKLGPSGPMKFRKKLSQHTLFVYFLSTPDKWEYYELDRDISLLQYFQFTFLIDFQL